MSPEESFKALRKQGKFLRIAAVRKVWPALARCRGEVNPAPGLVKVTFIPYKGARRSRRRGARGCMVFRKADVGRIAAMSIVLAALTGVTAVQAQEFPFGLEMRLEGARMPGTKRIPSLEIGDNGEVVLELWCKGGKGQFSVAGNTIIFVPGAMEERSCPPDRAQADDDLLAALSDAATWRRQGDFVTLVGSKQLRFRINTN
jgi:heat shock protein HslJ